MNQEKDVASNVTTSENIENSKVQRIPLDKLVDFKHHAFKPYTGERLKRLTESIKNSGIIQPLVVRQVKGKDKYEIISGHNRKNAAKEAGLTEVPTIVVEISDDNAIILANETNISQRTFMEWEHSEKAKSISQYHTVIKNQGARSDLKSETSRELQDKLDAQQKTASVYGTSVYTVELYLQLHRMIPSLMERLDLKEFGVTPARHISHISKESQKLISTILAEDNKKEMYGITMTNSKELRRLDKEKKLTEEKIRELLSNKSNTAEEFAEDNESESKPTDCKTITMEAEQYEEHFSGKVEDEIAEEIVEAMEVKKKVTQLASAYFSNGEPLGENEKEFIRLFKDYFQKLI